MVQLKCFWRPKDSRLTNTSGEMLLSSLNKVVGTESKLGVVECSEGRLERIVKVEERAEEVEVLG